MSYTILVIGGTGLVGGAVARRLQADGYHVKIMDRNIDSADDIHDDSVVWGDVLNRQSLEKALWECSGIHISISEEVEREGVENIASVAADLAIERITYTSGTNVVEANAWSPIIEGKLMAEKAIQSSGVPYTIFRPTYFMDDRPTSWKTCHDSSKARRPTYLVRIPSRITWLPWMIMQEWCLVHMERKQR